jgi:hypothetical protein
MESILNDVFDIKITAHAPYKDTNITLYRISFKAGRLYSYEFSICKKYNRMECDLFCKGLEESIRTLIRCMLEDMARAIGGTPLSKLDKS